MKKVLVSDPMNPDALEKLKSLPGLEITVKTGMNEEELINFIPEFHIAVIRGATKMTQNVIQAASNLELIVRAGIGLDNVDKTAAEEMGIRVNNTPAATTTSVAEHTLGLMLAAVRNHGKANLSMKAHRWEKKVLSGTELFQKTLGIIGSGRIGLEVARLGLAFGMQVIVYDIVDVQSDLDLRQVGLDELLTQSDVISLHLPLNEQTKHMISDDEFAKMKDAVILVNASRGGTVDEKALFAALESGKVRAAGIDVFEKEPPDEYALIDHPNVIATPHIGAGAKEGQKRAGFEVVSIVGKYVRK
jgi:D-3-phosphoglycerate dehydrogenase